jgi:VanZ family protein
MAFIFVLSSVSFAPELPTGMDKNAHAVLYAGLSILAVRALTDAWQRRVTMVMVLASVAIGSIYGVTDEYHQLFVPLRQAEAMDVVADTIGAGIGAVAAYVWDIIRGRHGV